MSVTVRLVKKRHDSNISTALNGLVWIVDCGRCTCVKISSYLSFRFFCNYKKLAYFCPAWHFLKHNFANLTTLVYFLKTTFGLKARSSGRFWAFAWPLRWWSTCQPCTWAPRSKEARLEIHVFRENQQTVNAFSAGQPGFSQCTCTNIAGTHHAPTFTVCNDELYWASYVSKIKVKSR